MVNFNVFMWVVVLLYVVCKSLIIWGFIGNLGFG